MSFVVWFNEASTSVETEQIVSSDGASDMNLDRYITYPG
jgi:hypothetical protein